MAKFDYFVVFAEMRTGSNYLEANINLFNSLSCFGEAFNPSFVGYPKDNNILGIGLEQREKNPVALIETIKAQDGLCGFRFFNNHDPRALDVCLPDPHCAKIILTRNPVDSFVSWKIAQVTGQWKLTNATHAKIEQITFDSEEFEAYLATTQAFQVRLLNALQKSGQTAFYLAYEDLHDVDIMNGLAAFLGSDEQLVSLNRKLKKQNPDELSDKVSNFAEMETALARLDRFDLNRTPNFEPRRGPMVPTYVAAPRSALLYVPLRSGLDDKVSAWLAALDSEPTTALRIGFSQKTLRQWQNEHVGHRSFAVLQHPVVRAHDVFCDRILYDGPKNLPKIRATLRKVHKLPIPRDPMGLGDHESFDIAAHRTAFLAFLAFLKNNLSAQTSVRIDPFWASQLTLLQGIAQFALPDVIMRGDRLDADLWALAAQVGHENPPSLPETTGTHDQLLTLIYDAEIECATRDAYQRDYTVFGLSDWV